MLLIASDSVKDRELPPRARANFEIIRKNIELEARLIDDLLDLTRITHGKVSLSMSVLDARQVLRDAIANTKPEAEEKRIKIVQHLDAAAHLVRGDSFACSKFFGTC